MGVKSIISNHEITERSLQVNSFIEKAITHALVIIINVNYFSIIWFFLIMHKFTITETKQKTVGKIQKFKNKNRQIKDNMNHCIFVDYLAFLAFSSFYTYCCFNPFVPL